MSPAVPSPVLRLLATKIDTFDKLDVVMGLRASPGMRASVEDLCESIRVPREVVRTTSVALASEGLVELTGAGEVRLVVGSPDEEAVMCELDRLHATDRVVLVRALGELAIERIRRMAPHAFVNPWLLLDRDEKLD